MRLQSDPTTQDLLGAKTQCLQPADFHDAKTCVAVLKRSGRIALVSTALIETIGLDDDSQIVGRHWCKTWPEAAHAPLLEAVTRAWHGVVSTYWVSYPNIDGIPTEWDIRISPIFNVDGAVVSVLAVSRPVTKH